MYFYAMAPEAERMRVAAPQHGAYWDNLALPDYLGGPTADLVLREHFCHHFIDAHVSGDRLRDLLRVTGDHHGPDVLS